MMARRRKPAMRTCLVTSCRAPIPRWKWLCDGCWRRLPFDRRRAIAQAGEEHAPHKVAELATEGAAWIEAHSPAAIAARRQGESR